MSFLWASCSGHNIGNGSKSAVASKDSCSLLLKNLCSSMDSCTYLFTKDRFIKGIPTPRPQFRPITSLSLEDETGIHVFVKASQGFQCAADVGKHWTAIRRMLKHRKAKERWFSCLKWGNSAAKLITTFKCIMKVSSRKPKCHWHLSSTILQKRWSVMERKLALIGSSLCRCFLHSFRLIFTHTVGRLDYSCGPYSFRNWSKNRWAQDRASYK